MTADTETRIAELEDLLHVRGLELARVRENCDEASERIAELEAELSKFTQAVGLASTLKPDLVIDVTDPVGMMAEVERYVRAELEAAAMNELRALQAFANRPGVKWGDVATEIDRRIDALGERKGGSDG